MHAALLKGVLAARLSFFVSTPAGRVLNRFTGDVATSCASLHNPRDFYPLNPFALTPKQYLRQSTSGCTTTRATRSARRAWLA